MEALIVLGLLGLMFFVMISWDKLLSCWDDAERDNNQKRWAEEDRQREAAWRNRVSRFRDRDKGDYGADEPPPLPQRNFWDQLH